MSATLKLVSIGNSKGVRLPAEVIRRYHLQGEIQMEEMADGILLKPVFSQKLSLAASFAAMAQDQEALAEVNPWAESGLSDGLLESLDEEFVGWPH